MKTSKVLTDITQDLTDEQKATARSNINAGQSTVTYKNTLTNEEEVIDAQLRLTTNSSRQVKNFKLGDDVYSFPLYSSSSAGYAYYDRGSWSFVSSPLSVYTGSYVDLSTADTTEHDIINNDDLKVTTFIDSSGYVRMKIYINDIKYSSEWNSVNGYYSAWSPTSTSTTDSVVTNNVPSGASAIGYNKTVLSDGSLVDIDYVILGSSSTASFFVTAKVYKP